MAADRDVLPDPRKREHVYQIDSASLMLTSDNWIPLKGIHEVDLVHALTMQWRHFINPRRYDAKSAAPFPNAILLDGGAATPLHVISPLMGAHDQATKERARNAPEATVQSQWTEDLRCYRRYIIPASPHCEVPVRRPLAQTLL